MEETSYGFAELLRSFRKRRHLTQVDLATRLNVHRHTIGGWERARTRPDNKAQVLDLARLLRLDALETRQLLEASFIAPAPQWVVPYPRNPFFTGREEPLATLHRLLGSEAVVALTQSYVLSGLGGIGKSQLALEYAYRYALEYNAVFWVNAESPEQITSNFAAIAESLRLPERQATDQQQMVVAVQRWLNTHSRCLVIWDNLEDLELLPRFLAGARPCTLITTRAQAVGTLAEGLPLLPLPTEDAMLFLLRRAKLLPASATLKDLTQLAQRAPAEHAAALALEHLLEGLPLALDQAGAYIEETGCRIADYLEQYQAQRGQLLARRWSPSVGHPASVMATFTITGQCLVTEPTSIDLLRLCAYLAPDAIPEELITIAEVDLGEALAPVAANPLPLHEAYAALRRLSLVQRQQETRTFSLHRLVQAVQQECLSPADQRKWAERAVRLVAAAFPDSNDFATWERCQRLLPHALVCARHIERWHFTFPEAASLLNEAGHYLRQRAQVREALPLLEQALAIREQTVGPAHPDTATSINNLAAIYWQEGQFRKALPLFQQALTIREQILGPHHPDVARSLSNVATLYRHLGQYQEAVPLFLRALIIFEQTLGPEHPNVGTTLNNLADLYYSLGQYQEALPRYKQSLAIRELALGAKHPDVATTLGNLATIYEVQQQYEESLSLHRRALRIRERALGPDHPDVAASLSGMAMIYEVQQQYEEALRLHRRALKIRRQALGVDHPDGVNSMIGMANIYIKLTEYRQAEALYQKGLEICNQQLGPDHPEIARILLGLAALRSQQGNPEEARTLFQQALVIQERQLGSEHPETAQTRSKYLEFIQMKPSTLLAQSQRKDQRDQP